MRPAHLRLLDTAEGPRYTLNGRAVEVGEELELLIGFASEKKDESEPTSLLESLARSDDEEEPEAEPLWLQVRFEWSGKKDIKPVLAFRIPASADPEDPMGRLNANIRAPEGALLRRIKEGTRK